MELLNNEPATKLFRTFIYGSLRRGEYNHARFPGFPEAFQCQAVLRGAILKNLGAYPGIIPSGKPEDLVYGEVYDVPENLHDIIFRMEKNAGYDYLPVSVEVIANAEEAPGATYPIDASAYFIRWPEQVRDIPNVSSGDWTKR